MKGKNSWVRGVNNWARQVGRVRHVKLINGSEICDVNEHVGETGGVNEQGQSS